MSQRHSIRLLSDATLLNRLDKLAVKEQAATLEVLLHLGEMERRQLFLEQGHSSLFNYCTGRLGYSESAAIRRVRAARCMGKFPEIRSLLAEREVTVSTVSMIAGILDKQNKSTILREIRGRSQSQVGVIVARYKPESRLRDRVRPVAVVRTLPSEDITPIVDSLKSDVGASNDDETNNKWQEIYRRSGGKKLTSEGSNEAGTSECSTTCSSESTAKTVVERKFELDFVVDPGFMKKLDEVKTLLANRYPKGIGFAQLFEAVLDEFIDRHSPRKRQERRAERAQKRRGATQAKAVSKPRTRDTSKSCGENGLVKPATRPKNHDLKREKCGQSGRDAKRYIPAAVKDRVFTRDEGKCTYESANGKRCNSTWGLQIDHVKPFARGGANILGNLRLLCGKHNRLEAKRVFGTAARKECYARE
jgi:5-methylcytosine-specific restriction endonuclease McrA